MLSNSDYLDTLKNNKNIEQILTDAYAILETLSSKELQYLSINDYEYNPNIACDELGLGLELVNHLIEDYVQQILHTQTFFLRYINKLKDDKQADKELDYTSVRDLAHKNLGVARNLRIEVGEKILFQMMTIDDLETILKYLEALIATTIILNPECAYKVIASRGINDST